MAKEKQLSRSVSVYHVESSLLLTVEVLIWQLNSQIEKRTAQLLPQGLTDNGRASKLCPVNFPIFWLLEIGPLRA